jgi:hypothetical protein
MIASHFVFNSPRNQELKKRILRNVFNVDKVEEMGRGANPRNYARLAELKMITQFLIQYKKDFPTNTPIFAGDFNLTPDNIFVQKIIREDGQDSLELLVKEKTSTTLRRYNRTGEETGGLSNSYDHFLIFKNNFYCHDNSWQSDATSYSFSHDHFLKSLIEKKYKIRSEQKNELGYYIVTAENLAKGKKLWESFKKKWSSRQTIKNSQIVPDTAREQSTIINFKRRVLDSQLQDRTYYRFFNEIMSDHLPIFMSCQAH